jgi:phthiodiolone/phenolphthiodiolone dimycocerosates ketoreductase
MTRPPAQVVVAQAQAHEAEGYDAVWYSDHLLHWFPPGVWTPDVVPHAAASPTPHVGLDPMPLIAAAGQATERIRLGTAVTDAVRRHPAVLAQTFLTLDHLTGGRAILGIGVGEAANIVPYGIPFERAASRLVEAVEVIRLLWSTLEPVDFAGDHFRLESAIMGVRPFGETPPPIWVAAHRPRVLEMTGRLADGWMPFYPDPAGYARGLEALRAASVAAGRAEDAVVAGLYAFLVIAETREQAERALDSPLLRLLALTAPNEEYERAGAEHPLHGDWGILEYVPTRLTREQGLAAAAAVPGEVLRRYYFWGTPDDVADRLAGFRAAGMEHVDLVDVSGLGDPSLAAGSRDRVRAVADRLRASERAS